METVHTVTFVMVAMVLELGLLLSMLMREEMFLVPYTWTSITLFQRDGINQDSLYSENQDGSEQYPFGTISTAIVTARDGDSIIVYPGMYEELLVIEEKNLQIKSLFERTQILFIWKILF